MTNTSFDRSAALEAARLDLKLASDHKLANDDLLARINVTLETRWTAKQMRGFIREPRGLRAEAIIRELSDTKVEALRQLAAVVKSEIEAGLPFASAPPVKETFTEVATTLIVPLTARQREILHNNPTLAEIVRNAVDATLRQTISVYQAGQVHAVSDRSGPE